MGFEVKNMTKKQKMETIKKEEMIKNGDKIKVEYTGTFSDGKVFDSSKGREPLCFEVGAKQVIPGFEQAVIGMKKDENKTFLIKSEEAYGAVRAELIMVVPRDKLPEKPEPQPGMMLVMQGPTGQKLPARITKVGEGKVTIDLNHPLAGKDLNFEIKVMGINEPENLKEKKEDGCGEHFSHCSDCE